ncbi:MAG: response regulator transcription factor [Tissierellia bacterium]|nr:response regulator transcription factor [Tissierellia bacterium]
MIYCIEDDESIRDLIIYALNKNGFEAKGYESGEILYDNPEPDLIILDIMLPGDDGYTILEKLKENDKTSNIPVIMLTSKTNEFDKVKGLDLGADDYIEKPFGVMELISRIKAVLRRTTKSKDGHDKICVSNLCIDNGKHVVTVEDKEVTLTYKEYELLYYLMKNKGLVISRNKLISEVWGYDFEGESRTVDVHIRTLRLKLGEAGKLIHTIRSVGYKLEE